MNLNDQTRSSTEPQPEPGAYPIPFSTRYGVELGSRLDSISPALRYWAVDPKRTNVPWYNDMVEANNRYEEWLTTQPPGEYPMPFGDGIGKRLDEVEDSSRYWGIHPGRSSFPWYSFFKRANARYEEHLAATRKPGEFPYPRGNNRNYTGKPIKDIPQDEVWWALRPSNHQHGWICRPDPASHLSSESNMYLVQYQPMYDANKRMLNDVYKSRSPGSEPIWFGTRCRGLRLDQVYERKGFMRWCLDPQRGESGTFCRLKDLVERLQVWRQEHPERSGPRQRRKAPDIQNPVGEAIGPWDDSPGSAGEDDYDKDGFIQSDSDEIEYASDNDELMDDGLVDNDHSGDSDESASSSSEMRPSIRHPPKRRRVNMIMWGDDDDDDEEEEEGDVSLGKLGKRYRVPYGSSDSEE